VFIQMFAQLVGEMRDVEALVWLAVQPQDPWCGLSGTFS